MVEKQSRNRPSFAAIAGFGAVLVLAATIGYEVLQAPPVLTALPPPPPSAKADDTPRVTAPAVVEPPVRVSNPFDRSEVFEFPPGTTPEAAQAAVADTLLARARERQAEYDARHPKRRRSG
jgi:hypothetical protein